MLATGWWLTYPSEKYESQLGLLFPIYGKIKFMFQTTKQDMLAFLFCFCTSCWCQPLTMGSWSPSPNLSQNSKPQGPCIKLVKRSHFIPQRQSPDFPCFGQTPIRNLGTRLRVPQTRVGRLNFGVCLMIFQFLRLFRTSVPHVLTFPPKAITCCLGFTSHLSPP